MSLTLSESFWNPIHQWVSYEQNYPENRFPKSGQKSRLKIKNVNLELTDSYWTEKDIIDCANQSELSLLKFIILLEELKMVFSGTMNGNFHHTPSLNLKNNILNTKGYARSYTSLKISSMRISSSDHGLDR